MGSVPVSGRCRFHAFTLRRFWPLQKVCACEHRELCAKQEKRIGNKIDAIFRLSTTAAANVNAKIWSHVLIATQKNRCRSLIYSNGRVFLATFALLLIAGIIYIFDQITANVLINDMLSMRDCVLAKSQSIHNHMNSNTLAGTYKTIINNIQLNVPSRLFCLANGLVFHFSTGNTQIPSPFRLI